MYQFAPYHLNGNIKPPLHGPFEEIIDKETGKSTIVCLCQMCGKKNLHKIPGPPQNARLKRNTDL